MFTICPENMPEDIQQPLLELAPEIADLTYFEPGTTSLLPIRRAFGWFQDVISDKADDINSVTLRLMKPPVDDYHGSHGRNMDIHKDFIRRGNAVKFIVAVANFPSMSTIYFRDNFWSASSSADLFVRTGEGLLIPRPDLADDILWSQAINGQLSYFCIQDQYHASPPVFPGVERFILTAAGHI